jgi:hypothetical protein
MYFFSVDFMFSVLKHPPYTRAKLIRSMLATRYIGPKTDFLLCIFLTCDIIIEEKRMQGLLGTLVDRLQFPKIL